MTSRFRSNWAKEGPKSTSPTFDSLSTRNHLLVENEYRHEYFEDEYTGDDAVNKRRNGSRKTADDLVENRNGKSRDSNGASCYGEQRELDNESPESSDRGYYRRYKEDFRCPVVEVEDCARERRPSNGNRTIVVSSTTRYDRVENDDADNNILNVDKRLVSLTTMTNGNSTSTTRNTSNGSSKQVNRYEERRDRPATGSLTRERDLTEDSFPAINPRTSDAKNRSAIVINDRSNGRTREDSPKKTSTRDKTDEYYSSGNRGRKDEINEYGSLDRSRIKDTRDCSQSPIHNDDVNNENGHSLSRTSDVKRKETRVSERFYSPGRREYDEDLRSGEQRSRKNVGAKKYSHVEGNGDKVGNGNSNIVGTRLEHREKPPKDEEFSSMPRRSSRDDQVNYRDDNDINGVSKTNGNRDENGHSKTYRENDNDDNFPSRKGSSKRKSHKHHKTSPEDFDVQIHRYERALRGPRRDSDLSRKSSLKDHDSDLSRNNSFDDHHHHHHRGREVNSLSKKKSNRHRDSDASRRGSSEDREHREVGRKSSFKNRDTESTRKSSLTNRNSLDSNDNGRNNGLSSTVKHESSESLRNDRDPSITGRRSSRGNNDEDDNEKLLWKNDRHSRPLTPPIFVDLEDRDDSIDRRGGKIVSVPLKDRRVGNEGDDFARNYDLQDHSDCRGKTHNVTGGPTQERDRYSSSSRRVVSSRSINDSRSDNTARSGKTDNGNSKSMLRDLHDEEDPRDDNRRSGFSTVERNGTTVIRIRTDSDSPVGQVESRSRRRTSHQEINTARYRKYEDEAEDEDEDDEPFERESQRRNDHSRRDYKVGPRRLWNNRDGGIQITDLDDGQPCLHCGETCPGFSPHSWRKNCTSCKCPRESHDVCHEEWVSVRARLGLKGEGLNSYVGFDPRDRGLTWAPPGLPPIKVEEYFSMLPEISVPRVGTPGERHRDRQLATQLPKQDLARAYCRHLDSQHSASADDFMAARNEIALDIGSVKEILERGHECGVCHEPLKYGSLVISASKLGLHYHPSCFQCTQCRELLVDLAYCVHDDALYCERHYAEQLKPRCAACDELIFSGEYTKAMNKDWHSGHFCCWQCDESLTGQRYVLRDEHPYCIKCYESVFANGCEECSKIIGIDSKDLSYKDKHWHEACFLCNKCRVSLVDKQFGSKVDKIYCGNCYDAQFASRCDGCGEIFRAGTKKMEYKTRQWHEKCFCCVVCKNPIGTKSFIPREQEIYCAGCYEDKFATRCVKCNKIITSGGVTYKNEPWHRDCFTCSNCDNSLAGQRFTSRDDKPYCAECFGELFAKRCTACTKPITGIGGTRFISFEDRHWHNNCFICAGCQTSLVGRGFITDGDDIICPECAKQKLSE